MVYGSVFGVGYAYMMRLIRKGPKAHESHQQDNGGPGQHNTPARPLSAVSEPFDTDPTHSNQNRH
ncbi:putative cytochrome oxidase subunit [Yersinia enterocolitica]|nr:putative cytochrome oxidase subunit [Yersinia enterocolitica]